MIALLPHGDGPVAAEELFTCAVDQARRQEALSWEIRAATSLAQLWAGQGRDREAQTLLAGVYGRFTEGFETADLRAASRVLAELDRAGVPSKDPGGVILRGGPPRLDRVTHG
jgi:predicted ATPase